MCRLHVLSSFFAIVVGNKHFDYSVIKSNTIKIMLELSYTHSKNTFISQNTMDFQWFEPVLKHNFFQTSLVIKCHTVNKLEHTATHCRCCYRYNKYLMKIYIY